MKSTVSNQKIQKGELRAQEHLGPKSQGSQESTPAMAICIVAYDDHDDHDDGQIVVSSAQVSKSCTEDVIAKERISSLQSDGLGQGSRGNSTKIDVTDDQHARRPESNGLHVSKFTTLSPAMLKSRLKKEKRLPLPPATAEFQCPTFIDPYGSRPVNDWTGILPDPSQTFRLEENTEMDTKVSRQGFLVRGPTNPLGPPMKPFDGAIYEDEAQRMWAVSMQKKIR